MLIVGAKKGGEQPGSDDLRALGTHIHGKHPTEEIRVIIPMPGNLGSERRRGPRVHHIGVAGETWIWLGLPAGHPALRETGLRFIAFDGLGLLVMALAFAMLLKTAEPPEGQRLSHTG